MVKGGYKTEGATNEILLLQKAGGNKSLGQKRLSNAEAGGRGGQRFWGSCNTGAYTLNYTEGGCTMSPPHYAGGWGGFSHFVAPLIIMNARSLSIWSYSLCTDHAPGSFFLTFLTDFVSD